VSLQRLLGADRSHERFAHEHVRARPGSRVLDLGCGPGHALEVLGDVDYLGVDLSAEYIAAARERHGDRGRFRVVDVGADDLADAGRFDIVLAMGLLHHLDDSALRRMLTTVRSRLAPGARFVAIDPTLAEGQHPISRWLVSLDRGQHVRPPDALRALVAEVLPQTSASVRHDLLRVPYTHVVLESTI
jgi:SAM-dependent methyltransferase